MCNCTPTTTCNSCSQTIALQNCAGCQYTLGTDCVIYKDEVLSFENPDTKESSARTLTDILKLISEANCSQRESKIITEDYTILAEDTNKILLLQGFDDGVIGTITYTLTLPQTMDFANKELIIKDISVPQSPPDTDIVWRFNIAIQYQWDPSVASSVNLSALQTSTHKVTKLRFVKTTPSAYQWIVV